MWQHIGLKAEQLGNYKVKQQVQVETKVQRHAFTVQETKEINPTKDFTEHFKQDKVAIQQPYKASFQLDDSSYEIHER